MAKIVQMFAGLIVRHVNTLIDHVAAKLAGRDLAVI